MDVASANKSGGIPEGLEGEEHFEHNQNHSPPDPLLGGHDPPLLCCITPLAEADPDPDPDPDPDADPDPDPDPDPEPEPDPDPDPDPDTDPDPDPDT